jgi:uncharacterized membrane protein YeaQ/YmgE (transglycosylase-associated protein family)
MPEFTLEAILIWIVVGVVAGWLAGTLMRGGGFGMVGNLIVGVLGAFLASWLLPKAGLVINLGNGIVNGIVYATIGAVILLLLIGLVRRAG